MKRQIVGWILLGLIAVSPALAGGEIYGTVQTTDGKEYTGPISWDKNENYWDDRLDTHKSEIVEKQEQEGRFKVMLFGLNLGGDNHPTRNRLSIKFGHLRSIDRASGSEKTARLTLKSGEKIEVRAEDGDLGSRMRGLLIDGSEGQVKVRWTRLKRVDFRSNPDKEFGKDSERLHGTVETTQGSFTGFVTWDNDECLKSDILDGYADGEDHEISFQRIRSITTLENSVEVALTDGTSIVLGGTNDVNRHQRGTIVQTDTGAVQVEWRELVKVVFDETPPSPGYDSFDGGGRLKGTVRTRAGSSVSGLIAWDQDESHNWETLDGYADQFDYSIPFRSIRSIARQGARFSEVTLTDGKKLTLTGSNDVDEDNRGLIVTGDNGTETRIDWADTVSVEFE